jgi:hypothetical protein
MLKAVPTVVSPSSRKGERAEHDASSMSASIAGLAKTARLPLFMAAQWSFGQKRVLAADISGQTWDGIFLLQYLQWTRPHWPPL